MSPEQTNSAAIPVLCRTGGVSTTLGAADPGVSLLHFPTCTPLPDTGSQGGKLGKTDVKKDLFLLSPSEARYPAGLVGVIKSRVIIYQRASTASHFPRSKSGITPPTEWDSQGHNRERSLPLRVVIRL